VSLKTWLANEYADGAPPPPIFHGSTTSSQPAFTAFRLPFRLPNKQEGCPLTSADVT
jgi:hypothetical protein